MHRDVATARTRLPSPDGLRGVLAVVVVLWHATSPTGLTLFAIPAKLAVAGFFLLSGLVLTRAWDGRLSAFLAQRFVRLWPTYALCLAVGYGIAAQAPDWRQFLFFPLIAPDAAPRIDPPIWSLIVEAWAMPLMPLIVWASREKKRAALAIFALCALTGLLADRAAQQLPMALGCFVAGAYLSRSPPRARWLETAPAQWLGKISYSLYLSHWLVFALAARALGPMGGVYALPLAFPVGWALWWAVERPSVAASRRLKAWLIDRHEATQVRRRAAADVYEGRA